MRNVKFNNLFKPLLPKKTNEGRTIAGAAFVNWGQVLGSGCWNCEIVKNYLSVKLALICQNPSGLSGLFENLSFKL
jgi:hypothetical protein